MEHEITKGSRSHKLKVMLAAAIVATALVPAGE
ncbi:hypothetical protein BMS3Bbin02_01264 [bacterium BMS3Bbin02]|nr:hypothetical protein BMS3Bbin02_01264 [bacterium BMS3Bbin02]